MVVEAPLPTVPVMAPVLELIERPVGSPEAEKLSVPAAVSVAVIWTETASPMALVWSPWSVMVMAPFTVQSTSAVLL